MNDTTTRKELEREIEHLREQLGDQLREVMLRDREIARLRENVDVWRDCAHSYATLFSSEPTAVEVDEIRAKHRALLHPIPAKIP